MTARTRGNVWKMIAPRSRGWLCCFRQQMLSNFVSSKRPFPWCKRLSLPKRLTQRCPPRLQRVIYLARQSHLPTTGSETFPGTSSRQLNLFSMMIMMMMMMMRKRSLDPKPDAINEWTSMQDLTDMAMALFFQYQQWNFSRPMRLQFLWKDGREILALKASLRIRLRLVMVWSHLESNCNESASNPPRLPQGSRLVQLCRYKRERTKPRRSSRWSLYLKDARKKIKRLLVKRSTMCVSSCSLV